MRLLLWDGGKWSGSSLTLVSLRDQIIRLARGSGWSHPVKTGEIQNDVSSLGCVSRIFLLCHKSFAALSFRLPRCSRLPQFPHKCTLKFSEQYSMVKIAIAHWRAYKNSECGLIYLLFGITLNNGVSFTSLKVERCVFSTETFPVLVGFEPLPSLLPSSSWKSLLTLLLLLNYRY